MRHVAVVLVLAAIATPSLAAQDAASRLTFEVAAIKRNVSVQSDGRLAMSPGGHFRAVNFDARTLVAFAFRTKPRNLRPSQIIGAPDWLSRERYDIVANVGPELVARAPSDPFQTPKLVRALLEDRFGLKAHREKREQDVYALVPTGKDAFPGPQLRVAGQVDCAKDRQRCAIRSIAGHLTAGAISMETLCDLLSTRVGRLVVDHSGSAGQFDVELDWAPEEGLSDKPSIFTAVQEQLGLKLESAREPVDVVVIDHVERPTED